MLEFEYVWGKCSCTVYRLAYLWGIRNCVECGEQPRYLNREYWKANKEEIQYFFPGYRIVGGK